jgi:predicted dehydrogenase
MKTRVLMIGLGSIGQRHLRNIRTLLGDTTEIAAYRVLRQAPVLTDTMQVEVGGILEDKYSLTVFDNLDSALAWGPTTVFICNPSSLHLPVALAAARAGAHLFIEKPLSHNLEKIDELCEVLEKRNLIGMVGYQMRFHPCLQKTQELLKQKAVGRVLAVRAEFGEYLPDWHPWEDYRLSYASRKELGGGVLLVLIHEMDYLYWLFGLPSRIYSVGGHLSSLEVNVEDTVSTLMDCGGIPVYLHQDFIQSPPSRKLEIVGDCGTIQVDLRELSVTVYRRGKAESEFFAFPDFDRNQMFLDELRHFFECVKSGAQPIVTVRDGAQSLRIAIGAQESLEKKCLISLL